MWERQYEHGRWNGHKLNILSTAIDGGQRLHVSEIPYAELPHIKVMGTKALSFAIETVFVGPSSLADANTLIAKLDANPKGELEHPWLGELPLVCEDHSLSLSTKKGLVTVSLKFIRSGVTPDITAPTVVRAKEQALLVDELSTESFEKDVAQMSVSQINQTQANYTKALNVLVDIYNRLSLADETAQQTNHAINEAFSAVSSLSNEAKEFSTLFTNATTAVADGVQSEPSSVSEAVDNSRTAQALMLKQVSNNTTTHHYNMQMMTGAIRMSKDLTTLEQESRFDVTKTDKQPAIIQSDLAALVVGVDDRIKDTTQVSTMESTALFDALLSMKGNVQAQHDKVIAGCEPHRLVPTPRFKPALAIAHDEYIQEPVISKLNALQHPLFMRGDIAVRDV